jgi:hypothetical protein
LILIERLAHITELDYLQNLVVLSKRLIQPDSIKPTPSDSLAMAVHDCAQKISDATLASFHEIAACSDINMEYETLWNWHEKGTRLAHLCSGGNKYFYNISLFSTLICLRDILYDLIPYKSWAPI